MQTMTQKEWLEHHGHTNVRPVKVTFGNGVVCEGCEYDNETFQGEPRLMLLTKDYKKLVGNMYFTRQDSPHEWFVACHASVELVKERPEQNPLGPYVILCAWRIDENIDKYHNKPYQRVTLKVDYL